MILILIPFFIFLAIWEYFIIIKNNFYAVIPGKIYRTAKLNGNALLHYNNLFHFKSMLNFCGAHANQKWYVIENKFAQDHHWHYVSIKFEPTQLPTKQLLQ